MKTLSIICSLTIIGVVSFGAYNLSKWAHDPHITIRTFNINGRLTKVSVNEYGETTREIVTNKVEIQNWNSWGQKGCWIQEIGWIDMGQFERENKK